MLKKVLRIYDPLSWIGFNCLKAVELISGDILLLTTKSTEFPGTHFIELKVFWTQCTLNWESTNLATSTFVHTGILNFAVLKVSIIKVKSKKKQRKIMPVKNHNTWFSLSSHLKWHAFHACYFVLFQHSFKTMGRGDYVSFFIFFQFPVFCFFFAANMLN